MPSSQEDFHKLSTDNLQAKLFEHAHQLLKTHETLLRDAERDRKFYDALRQRITPGTSVVDIGAGTGVWAIVAAKLGATRVVAIEMDELLIGVMQMLIDEHGVGDRVEMVCGSSFEVELTREFDLVVSETIGYLGYDEGIVEVMADARKRFLRQGGNIIPETVSLYAAAGRLNVRTEPIPVGVDIDFSSLVRLNLNSPRVLKRPRDVKLTTPPACLVSTDLRRAERTPGLTDLTAAWDISTSDRPDCVVVWVESRLAPRVKLSTRRGTTSWYPTVYRIDPPDSDVERLEFNLSLTAESNYWTATFIDSDKRVSRRYSPEFAATEMVAAARGHVVRNERGHYLVPREHQPPHLIELRDATPDDANFLCALYFTTRAAEVSAFGWSEAEQEAFLTMQFTMQQSSYAMQYPKARHSIILCDGKSAGRIMIDISGHDTHLVDLAVLPEFRNRGIASNMLGNLQKESQSIVLSVDKQNDAARRLYERFGFVSVDQTDLAITMRWSNEQDK